MSRLPTYNYTLNLLRLSGLFLIAIACSSGHDMTVVKPTEIDSTLLNPGRGFTTTGASYNEDLGNKRHPKSGVVQMRWYWNKIEPKEGKIDYAFIDDKVEAAHRNGQQLNFRIMCQNVKMRLPQWVIDKGVKRPYYDDPVFLKEQAKLIRALAERYDGNPDIAFVDIGTVGQWGEWHTTMEGQGIKMPADGNAHKIIDMYVDNFKKTPLLMLIGSSRSTAFKYALSKETGWRADCWGDMGKKWAHMKKFYPQALAKANAKNAWEKGPVALETCWTMRKWHKEGWDIDYILSKALEWHATEVNNGTQAIPKEWWPKVQKFEKKLGYRYVLKQLKYSSTVEPGSTMDYSMEWENKGVAPIYQPFPVAFRIRSTQDSTQSWMLKTDEDITRWMPGKISLKSRVAVPAGISQGAYEIDLGILNRKTMKAAISLAIDGKLSDGWYKLGKIKVSGS